MDDDKAGMFVRPPSGSFTSWENTMCNPLGDIRTQTQSAWHDGYASAKVEHEWQGLTDEEIETIRESCIETPTELRDRRYGWAIAFYRAIEAKLKEKNK